MFETPEKKEDDIQKRHKDKIEIKMSSEKSRIPENITKLLNTQVRNQLESEKKVVFNIKCYHYLSRAF